jgi:hypothetical protein
VLSKNIVPSLGLIPLFFSASASVYLLVAERALARAGKGKQSRGTDEPDVEASPDEAQVQAEGRATGATSILTHRIFVFFLDLVVAASLMVVLVFSWVGVAADGRADLAMLAAYSPVAGELVSNTPHSNSISVGLHADLRSQPDSFVYCSSRVQCRPRPARARRVCRLASSSSGLPALWQPPAPRHPPTRAVV